MTTSFLEPNFASAFFSCSWPWMVGILKLDMNLKPAAPLSSDAMRSGRVILLAMRSPSSKHIGTFVCDEDGVIIGELRGDRR